MYSYYLLSLGSRLIITDIIVTVDPMLSPLGNAFKCHEEVLYLQSLIPPKRFYAQKV